MNNIEEIASSKGYQITDCGKVLGVSGRFLSSNSVNKGGYKYFAFRHKGNMSVLPFHRLQAYQKYGESLYEKGIEVRHLNGNPLDNSWDNIAIGTHSENMMDIPKQIRIKKAFKASEKVRKYNKDLVKQYYNKTKSYEKTMTEFSISSKGTLHYILNS